MPTPFTHLAAAQRLLADDALPAELRALINAHSAAFLLGSIAPDGQGMAGLAREDTHFYRYDRPMLDHPWRVMLAQHPALANVSETGWRAFLGGYVAHLAMDEIWSLRMTGPQFALREWAPRPQRFLMLHILLIYMDERDLASLERGLDARLGAAEPHGWLPFLPDEAIIAWRDLIDRQIAPGGASETLDIFAPRVGKSPDDLRAILDSQEQMARDLWAHIPPPLLADIEAQMYAEARRALAAYLDGLPSEQDAWKPS